MKNKELKTWKDLLDEGVITPEQYKRGQEESLKWIKMLEDWHKDLSAFGSWVKCPKCEKWFIMLNAGFFERGYKLNCPLCNKKIVFQHEMIGPFTEFETMNPKFAIKQFINFFNSKGENKK